MFFWNVLVVCYRRIDVSPNLVGQFLVAKVILSINNDSDDFLKLNI